MSLATVVQGIIGANRAEIPHIPVQSSALGIRNKPQGRPLPESSVSQDGFKKYLERAAAIDYKPDITAIMFEKLKIAIAQNNILIYDSKVVHDWMNKVVSKESSRMTWVWKSLTEPLVKLAKIKPLSRGLSYQHQGWHDSRRVGEIDRKRRYTKVIPDAVLATAEAILRNFEKTDPVFLLVSDYEVAVPDPFLAVAIPGHPFLIVDFWDEPGFQPKAAEMEGQKELNK